MIRRIDDRPKSRTVAPKPRKHVPSEREHRERVREQARELTRELSRSRPLKRADIEHLGRTLLADLGLSDDFLGFAMVAVSNEFWRPQFAAIPYARRLLLLPHCLRRASVCRGTYSALGLECASCGACAISQIKHDAETLGYRVLVAEGTPAVMQLVLSGKSDAILGVACLDSLEKAFERVVDLGIPNVATPLLVDGCVETTAEFDQMNDLIRLHASRVEERTPSYVYLLRSAERLFEPGILDALLADEVQIRAEASGADPTEPMLGTEAIGLDWLRTGGKRFRPFITLASYAAMTLGKAALRSDADLADAFPEVVQRAALAIEALHKASLVHDDIEDDDAYRYGLETIHRRYGVPNAVNVGDYLIGLGYRMIASGADELGGDCVSEMLSALSRSHVRLSRGQGAELLWRGRDLRGLRPLDCLSIYALKTAPAFEAAMVVGLRAAGPLGPWAERLDAYARYLGVAYQVLNDLKDLRRDARDKMLSGQDLLSGRPTVLLAFALESADEARAAEVIELLHARGDDAERLARLQGIYETLGVTARAEALVDRYRRRAVAAASGTEPESLRELMHFILDVLLR